MSKGESGRVVIEVEPALKRRLYSALAIDNSTLKQWFIAAAEQYVEEREQPSLPEIVSKDQKAKRP
jgi:hypothetical protein